MRVLESLNQALHDLMGADPNLHVIGEDIKDPYGGAFKVTRGLSERFPERVLTSPISEAAIIGFATGMAMHGKPTIVEIMFGDFLTLGMDQLVNHATKFPWMYNEQVKVPLIVRTPMGGYRGYGPTHSQSLEKHFLGVPGLTVFAVNRFSDPGDLLRAAYQLGSPCLVVENKILYARPLATLPRIENPDLTVIAYGYGVDLAVEAASQLYAEEEIRVDVLPVTQLHPLPASELIEAARRSRRVLVVEEGTETYNFGSECARHLIGAVERFETIAAPLAPIPSSRAWELEVLPGVERVRRVILEML